MTNDKCFQMPKVCFRNSRRPLRRETAENILVYEVVSPLVNTLRRKVARHYKIT
jgi:hypothetical protein